MSSTPSEKLGAIASGRLDGATPEMKQLALIRLGAKQVDTVVAAHLAEGIEPSPLQRRYLHESLLILCEPAHETRLRMLRALERNITSLVREHHAWRHAHAGNVVWEFSGPTGIGKSSCMLHLLETLNHVKPEVLDKHVTIDVPALPQLLPHLASGSGLAVDEQSNAVGEGSQTQGKILRNMEDQIRYSQIDLYWASPESKDHATSQGEFVALGANYEKQYTRFLVYLHDVPLGYANIPWCSPAMWQAYEPIKRRNVDRALRALFKNDEVILDEIWRFFDKPAVLAATKVRRLKVGDWKRLVKRFAVTLNTSQVTTMAEEIEFLLETLLSRSDLFETIYPRPASQNMIEAANANVQQRRG